MVDILTYADKLTEAMTWLGQRSETIFIGQSVAYGGNALFKTLSGVPMEKRIELPVAEEMQMGMSIGLAMMGKTVISIFPRMDFLLCAMSQLVNHLDKDIYLMKGRVIVRTCVGSKEPMHPGVQHCGDYSKGLWEMLKTTPVRELRVPGEILTDYMYAAGAYVDRYCPSKNWVMIEYGDMYGMV